MGKLESIMVLFISLLLLAFCILYVRDTILLKKMQKSSIRLLYVKDGSFMLMRNAGDNPCETNQKFKMYGFSQDCKFRTKTRMEER